MVVKPRPQQSNRNRIVQSLPRRKNRTLRIALKCLTTSFVMALPEETWNRTAHERVREPPAQALLF